MSNEPLTVIKPQESGALQLSDGATYLISVDQHPIAARWQVGQAIDIIPSVASGLFELRAVDAPDEVVRAKRV